MVDTSIPLRSPVAYATVGSSTSSASDESSQKITITGVVSPGVGGVAPKLVLYALPE